MDENTDNSTKMQVVINLRYINISGSPLEHLLAVLEASSSTGEALSNKLLEILEQLGLSTDQLVGQALRWCSNLEGYIMVTSESHKSHAFAGTIRGVSHTVYDLSCATLQTIVLVLATGSTR